MQHRRDHLIVILYHCNSRRLAIVVNLLRFDIIYSSQSDRLAAPLRIAHLAMCPYLSV